jgi:hypothetical protein
MEETLLRPGVVKTADRRLKPKPLRANHWLYNVITSLRRSLSHCAGSQHALRGCQPMQPEKKIPLAWHIAYL